MTIKKFQTDLPVETKRVWQLAVDGKFKLERALYLLSEAASEARLLENIRGDGNCKQTRERLATFEHLIAKIQHELEDLIVEAN